MRHFLLEEQHENNVAAVTMLAMVENEQWKKGEQEHVRHFLHKKSLWKFHVVVVQNNGKEIYKKSVLHV